MHTLDKPLSDRSTAQLLDREEVLHKARKYWFLRRTQDVVLSIFAMVVLWPLMLLVSLIIVIDSPGAGPFYSQVRVGRDGKEFVFHKFLRLIICITPGTHVEQADNAWFGIFHICWDNFIFLHANLN